MTQTNGMKLERATRKQVKLKLNISSPTGYGKTVGALMIAKGMGYDWDKIAIIDSENKSASLYANHTLPNGYHIGEFQTVQLEPDFTPEKYSEAIRMCEDSGIEVIIIDSVTHVWKGKGGLLEYNQSLGGRYQDWAKTDPRYLKWLSSILNSKCHVICTSRKKQAYEMIKGSDGKITVEKKGLEDQIRDGFDYEMTIAFEVLNDKHLAQTSKDRSSIFDGKPEFVITEETGRLIKEWCDKGVPVVKEPTVKEKAMNRLREAKDLKELSGTYGSLADDLKRDSEVINLTNELKEKLKPTPATA